MEEGGATCAWEENVRQPRKIMTNPRDSVKADFNTN
jgi:hypothetical protein